MAASLVCDCGAVRVSLALAAVHRNQCCCVDCRKGIRFCTEQGGAPVRSETGVDDPPADLLYFPNAVKVVSGSEHLKCFVIKSGFCTKRVIASCCWTALLGAHPNYRGIVCVTYPGHATLHLADAGGGSVIRPYDARIRQGDMSEDELAALPPWEPSPTRRDFQASLAAGAAALNELSGRGQQAIRGLITVQSLIGSLGVGVAYPDHDGPIPEFIRERNLLVQYRILPGADGDARGTVTAVFTVPEGMAEVLVQHPILANGSQFDLDLGPNGSNTITSTFTSGSPAATAEAIKQRLLGRVGDPSPPGMEACTIQ